MAATRARFSRGGEYVRSERWMFREPCEVSHRIRELLVDFPIQNRLQSSLLQVSGTPSLVMKQPKLSDEAHVGKGQASLATARMMLLDSKISTLPSGLNAAGTVPN